MNNKSVSTQLSLAESLPLHRPPFFQTRFSPHIHHDRNHLQRGDSGKSKGKKLTFFYKLKKTPKHQEQIYTTTIDAVTEGALK